MVLICMAIPMCLSAIFTTGNISDFLFASLDGEILPKGDLLYEKEFARRWANSGVDPHLGDVKSLNNRVTSWVLVLAALRWMLKVHARFKLLLQSERERERQRTQSRKRRQGGTKATVREREILKQRWERERERESKTGEKRKGGTKTTAIFLFKMNIN